MVLKINKSSLRHIEADKIKLIIIKYSNFQNGKKRK